MVCSRFRVRLCWPLKALCWPLKAARYYSTTRCNDVTCVGAACRPRYRRTAHKKWNTTPTKEGIAHALLAVCLNLCVNKINLKPCVYGLFGSECRHRKHSSTPVARQASDCWCGCIVFYLVNKHCLQNPSCLDKHEIQRSTRMGCIGACAMPVEAGHHLHMYPWTAVVGQRVATPFSPKKQNILNICSARNVKSPATVAR